LFLIEKLMPKKELLDTKFKAYEKYLWCGNFQEDIESCTSFSPLLLEKLSSFGYRIYLNNYLAGS